MGLVGLVGLIERAFPVLDLYSSPLFFAQVTAEKVKADGGQQLAGPAPYAHGEAAPPARQAEREAAPRVAP